jgi:phosphate transport system substrate-binding protein
MSLRKIGRTAQPRAWACRRGGAGCRPTATEISLRPFAYALAVGLATVQMASAALAADITGAGATFPFPVYSKWAEAYRKETGSGLNYQSIGSGGGIKQIQARTVDFGATDAPLKAEQLAKDGLVQFPTVMGGVVPVVNIPGIEPGKLKLTGEVLAEIYAGKIAKWTDPRIAKLNDGLKLPESNITPVYRSDASGTTNIFTTYLSQASETWKKEYGAATTISWPVGQGGKGNEGVTATVKQVPNSIGYVESAYAKQNRLAYALLQNKAGKFPRRPAPTGRRPPASASRSPTSRATTRGRSRRRPSSSSTRIRPIPPRWPTCSSSSTGPTRRATSWPPTSTMFRCPTTSWR